MLDAVGRTVKVRAVSCLDATGRRDPARAAAVPTTLGRRCAAWTRAGPSRSSPPGWQEREADDAELRGASVVAAVNLRLHGRGARCSPGPRARVAALSTATALRRAAGLLPRAAPGRAGTPCFARRAPRRRDDLAEARDGPPIEALRDLDDWQPARSPGRRDDRASQAPVERRRSRATARGCARSSTCAAGRIAGGHVALAAQPAAAVRHRRARRRASGVAWSAGAMALTDRVVLFHDPAVRLGTAPRCSTRPRPGAAGSSCCRTRGAACDLDDRARIARFARRFAAPRLRAARRRRARPVRGSATARPAGRRALATTARDSKSDGAVDADVGRRMSAPRSRSPAARPAPLDARGGRRVPRAPRLPARRGRAGTFVWRGEADAVQLRHWVFGLPSTAAAARASRAPTSGT